MPHADPAARRDYLAVWKAANAEHVKAERRRYREANRDRVAAKDRSRYLAATGRPPGDNRDLRRKAGPELVARMARLYRDGESVPAVAAAVGMSECAVRGNIKSQGVKIRDRSESQRLYALDESAFDTITEASAYWAGFLMADGCISRNSVVLSLAAKDADHVQAFAAFLGSNKPVSLHAAGRTGKSKGTFARFDVRSCRLTNALRARGVTPRKTFTATAPAALEDDRHFWRGLIDGDGTMAMTRGHISYPVLCISGASHMLMQQFARFCTASLGGKVVRARRSRERFWSVSVAGTFAARMAAILYGDAKVSLGRKAAAARLAALRTFRPNRTSYLPAHL